MEQTGNRKPEFGRRFVVNLPQTISQTGIDRIKATLAARGHAMPPDDWDWSWLLTAKGFYTGTLPKRLAKFYAVNHGDKLTPYELSIIGTIGQEHNCKVSTYYFDFTDDLYSWQAGDFGEPSNSCFWESHEQARVMLERNGACAVRFYKNQRQKATGIGRAWLAPHPPSGGWIVFNAYADGGFKPGYTSLDVARLLGHLWSCYYRKIELRNGGCANDTLWINWRTPKSRDGDFEYSDRSDGDFGTGYLVGPYESVHSVAGYDLDYQVPRRTYCYDCGDYLGYGNSELWHSAFWCRECLFGRSHTCPGCGERAPGTNPDAPCDHCLRHSFICRRCHNPVNRTSAVTTRSGHYHPACYGRPVKTCNTCHKTFAAALAKEVGDVVFCPACYQNALDRGNLMACAGCGQVHLTFGLQPIRDRHFCPACVPDNLSCDLCQTTGPGQAIYYWCGRYWCGDHYIERLYTSRGIFVNNPADFMPEPVGHTRERSASGEPASISA